MMRFVMVIAALALAGCASDVMRGYMGKPMQEAMIDYGPPSNAFDMPDGRRAFQWVMSETVIAPTTVNANGSVRMAGNAAWYNSNATISGGQPITSTCAYTMIAHWDAARNAWIFDEFRKPSFMCE